MPAPTSIANETIPSQIQTINIITETVVLGNADCVEVNQQCYPSGDVITLPEGDSPISGSFKLYKNGQMLTPTTDYTIADGVVTLVVTPIPEDVYLYNYLTVRT